MIVTIPKNTTLLRLVINNKDKFYNQDWYFNEEFANEDIGGIWDVAVSGTYPAGVIAWCYLYQGFMFPETSLWTSSHDNVGDQIYLEMPVLHCMQVHRYLKLDNKKFVNPGGRDKC